MLQSTSVTFGKVLHPIQFELQLQLEGIYSGNIVTSTQCSDYNGFQSKIGLILDKLAQEPKLLIYE